MVICQFMICLFFNWSYSVKCSGKNEQGCHRPTCVPLLMTCHSFILFQNKMKTFVYTINVNISTNAWLILSVGIRRGDMASPVFSICMISPLYKYNYISLISSF